MAKNELPTATMSSKKTHLAPVSFDNPIYRGSTADPRSPRDSPDQLETVYSEIGEVQGIMRNNISKVLDRDMSLTQIENQAETLKDAASTFQRYSKGLRTKMWLRDKMWTIACALVTVITTSIVIVLLVKNT